MTNKTKSLSLLIILLVIAVCIIVQSMKNKSKPQNTKPSEKQSQHTPISKSVIENIDDQKDLKQIQNPPIKSQQDEIKPDKPLFYSDNSFINHTIIMGLHYDCIQLFRRDKKERNKKKIRRKQSKISIRRAERFKECQKVNDEHPDFYLNNEKYVYKNQSESNSLLEKGFSFKVAFGEDYETDSQFIKELTQTDSRVLLSPSAYYTMSSFHMANSTAIVMNLIQSQQIGYVLRLLNMGQIIYNCNKNNGCDRNSTIMYYLCMSDENNCDLKSYKEYIELTMTQGQKADLAIVVKYIETLFENQ